MAEDDKNDHSGLKISQRSQRTDQISCSNGLRHRIFAAAERVKDNLAEHLLLLDPVLHVLHPDLTY